MSNHHEIIQNQPDKLMKAAKKSAKEQISREKILMKQGWRWIKDSITRSHKLVPPDYNI